jgi:hypothetical protein
VVHKSYWLRCILDLSLSGYKNQEYTTKWFTNSGSDKMCATECNGYVESHSGISKKDKEAILDKVYDL